MYLYSPLQTLLDKDPKIITNSVTQISPPLDSRKPPSTTLRDPRLNKAMTRPTNSSEKLTLAMPIPELLTRKPSASDRLLLQENDENVIETVDLEVWPPIKKKTKKKPPTFFNDVELLKDSYDDEHS